LKIFYFWTSNFEGQIAQSVEQRTENPCVGGSIPSLPTSGEAVNKQPFLFVAYEPFSFFINQ
jgi:hypothetical protein